VFKLKVSERGYVVDFLVSIFSWSKPPHDVKVNPLGRF
jgi:hypothetical protein